MEETLGWEARVLCCTRGHGLRGGTGRGNSRCKGVVGGRGGVGPVGVGVVDRCSEKVCMCIHGVCSPFSVYMS